MRKNILFGTWKDRLTIRKSIDLAEKAVKDTRDLPLAFQPVVCPSFVALQAVAQVIKGSKVLLAAQNMRWDEPKVVLTGEISAEMLLEVGCTYVILGHSERRLYLSETNSLISSKVNAAVKHGLVPVVCIGERYEERSKGVHLKIIKEQIDSSVAGLSDCKQHDKVVFAYEPAWAISTSQVATPLDPEEANRMHKIIRNFLADNLGKEFGQNVTIVYGGSVNEDNVGLYFSQPEIDGGLVGTASQTPESLSKLIRLSQSAFSGKIET